ncbi:MAG: galactose-1-phosphate uridylyltransferase [Thermofilaceae archaeon]
MFKQRYRKPDGRSLVLYSMEPKEYPWLGEGEKAPSAAPQLRWHPLRQEWVVYAPHRQERTFLPPPEYCPLCPTRPGTLPTEIPCEDFEVAVFENRFPSLHPRAPVPEKSCVPTLPAKGVCEVVVYTSKHQGSLASLSPKHRELLVRVWIDRYLELYAYDFVRFVMPFENRGEEVGVTLHHPHGQIYAYSFLPPLIELEARAFRGKAVLDDLLQHIEPYLITTTPGFVAFVPPFARYPYEVWVVPEQRVAGPWEFTNAQVESFAEILGSVVAGYDRLFNRPFPYVMVFHAAPKGEESCYHFHVEFYPPLRAPGKLKFLAGTELGAGVMVVDALPETTASLLREVMR